MCTSGVTKSAYSVYAGRNLKQCPSHGVIAMYPTDQVGRQKLADELTGKGLKPTQAQQDFKREKINQMIAAMQDGTFDWYKASLRPIVMGPGGEVLGGHHRDIAAHLAGIDLAGIPGPRPQVQTVPMNFRQEYDWIDVLPDVQ